MNRKKESRLMKEMVQAKNRKQEEGK